MLYLSANQREKRTWRTAKIDRESDRIEAQLQLAARLSPAAFVEQLQKSNLLKYLRSWEPSLKSLRGTAEGHFETPESFSRTLRVLGSLDRSLFTAEFAAVMRAAVEVTAAGVIHGVLDASARTASWCP